MPKEFLNQQSLIYILSNMQSFVKNEINSLKEEGVRVKPILLGRPPERGKGGWHYIVEGYDYPLFVSEPTTLVPRLLSLARGFLYLMSYGKIHSVPAVAVKMLGDCSGKRMAFYRFRYASEIASRIITYRPQRIVTHFAWGNAYVSAYVARLLNVPLSITVHADDIFGLDLKEKVCLKWLFEQAEKVVTISGYNKRYLVSKKLCQPNKICVIHCGIPIDKFKFSHYRPNDDIFRIVTLPSGFVEKKGLSVLLEAIKLLTAENKRIECLVVGDDFYSDRKRKYEEVVQAMNLGSHIRFLGAVPQSTLMDLYKDCDAFVLPCLKTYNGKMDGIPVSLMEAMAIGLPVISTKISGIPELIEDGKEGLLVKPRDTEGLAKAIQLLIRRQIDVEKITIAARMKVEKEFNSPIIAREIIEKLHLNT